MATATSTTRPTPPSRTQISPKNRRVLIQSLIGGLAVLLVGTYLVPRVVPEAPDPIGWQNDLSFALQQAHRSNMPLLVYFTADWCSACRKLNYEVFPQPQVSQLIRHNFIPVKIDRSKPQGPNQPIAVKYRVDLLPTLLVIDPTGAVSDRLAGATSTTQLLEHLKRHTPGAR